MRRITVIGTGLLAICGFMNGLLSERWVGTDKRKELSAAPTPPSVTPSPQPPSELSDYRTPATAVRTELLPVIPARPLVLGIYCTADVATGRPRVASVQDDSHAARSGLQLGDVIIAFNGSAVPDLTRLREHLAATSNGSRVVLRLLRGRGEFDRLVCESGTPDGPPSERKSLLPMLPTGHPARPPTQPVSQLRLAVAGIAFADAEPNRDWDADHWETALFSRNRYTHRSPTGQPVHGSAADWFAEQSAGRFRLTGKFLGWFPMAERKTDLATRNANGNDWPTRALELVRQASRNRLVEFDAVCLLIPGEPAGRAGGVLWPKQHEATLSADAPGEPARKLPFILVPEDGRVFPEIALFVHEIGHLLGLPDQYGLSGQDNLGPWCTMALGHKGGRGRGGARPNHLCAWCKMRLGWLDPTPIDPGVPQHLRLRPKTRADAAGDVFQVLLRPDGREYLLLENRTRLGFDSDLPAEGLLIWRVLNFHQVELESADGLDDARLSSLQPQRVPFPQPGRNLLAVHTRPSGAAKLAGGRGVTLSHIRRHPDGELTLAIGFELY